MGQCQSEWVQIVFVGRKGRAEAALVGKKGFVWRNTPFTDLARPIITLGNIVRLIRCAPTLI